MKRATADFGDIHFGDLVSKMPFVEETSSQPIKLTQAGSVMQQSTIDMILTGNELKDAMQASLPLHERPMSDAEYDYFLQVLKDKALPNGQTLYLYELAALGRTMWENLTKFKPDMYVDPAIKSAAFEVSALDIIFKDRYENKHRFFINKFAEGPVKIVNMDIKARVVNPWVHPFLQLGLLKKK